MCLQETFLTPKIKEGEEPHIGYAYFRRDKISDHRAHGGVAVLVREDVPSTRIDLRTTLQAVAVKIKLHKSLTICSLYLPPNEQIDRLELDNLFQQLPGNVLVLGDYNAHNTLWHSNRTCTRGRIIETIVSKNDLIFLNGVDPTYMNPTSLSTSNIDLSVASSSLKHDFEWSVFGENLDSDHFPVLLTLTRPHRSTAQRIPQWILAKADWESFETLSKTERAVNTFECMQEMMTYFEETIINAAEQTIPKTSTNTRPIPVPW